ncbi:Cryptochrome-2 [Porphyridium purpureum]|uniref:Cryptochrome-2 n=1 Tax=Porphyridium purpureum TaxID=35688 RepID=A0A5J4Z9U2_PORPP|nr:Cryptochrome-2 [Porphyridium purpureum]|eukprot:POR0401..scf295_1
MSQLNALVDAATQAQSNTGADYLPRGGHARAHAEKLAGTHGHSTSQQQRSGSAGEGKEFAGEASEHLSHENHHHRHQQQQQHHQEAQQYHHQEHQQQREKDGKEVDQQTAARPKSVERTDSQLHKQENEEVTAKTTPTTHSSPAAIASHSQQRTRDHHHHHHHHHHHRKRAAGSHSDEGRGESSSSASRTTGSRKKQELQQQQLLQQQRQQDKLDNKGSSSTQRVKHRRADSTTALDALKVHGDGLQKSNARGSLPGPVSAPSPGELADEENGAQKRRKIWGGTSTSTLERQGRRMHWHRNPSIVWFRGHDLRLEDHPALIAAAQRGGAVIPVFVWSPEEQHGRGDTSRWWLAHSLHSLTQDFLALGIQFIVRQGDAIQEIKQILRDTGADAVFWNRLYEPDILMRDEEVRTELSLSGVFAESFKAEVLVEPWEFSRPDGVKHFQDFSSYMDAWMALPPPPQPLPVASSLQRYKGFIQSVQLNKLLPDLHEQAVQCLQAAWVPGERGARVALQYFLEHLFPLHADPRFRKDLERSSRLSPYLRFGEISPRRLYHAVRMAVSVREGGGVRSANGSLVDCARAFLKKVCLRDYSYHVLFFHPYIVDFAMVSEFKVFPALEDSSSLQRWLTGTTGFPIVDAAMRQLRVTGWVHNSLRTLLVTFFTKVLLLPWQQGLRELQMLLIDGDWAANAVGWQFASGMILDGIGVNVFLNPVELGRSMDPEGKYIREWLPELSALQIFYLHSPWAAPPDVLQRANVILGKTYPAPMLDLAQARARYGDALANVKNYWMSKAALGHPVASWMGVLDQMIDLPDMQQQQAMHQAQQAAQQAEQQSLQPNPHVNPFTYSNIASISHAPGLGLPGSYWNPGAASGVPLSRPQQEQQQPHHLYQQPQQQQQPQQAGGNGMFASEHAVPQSRDGHGPGMSPLMRMASQEFLNQDQMQQMQQQQQLAGLPGVGAFTALTGEGSTATVYGNGVRSELMRGSAAQQGALASQQHHLVRNPMDMSMILQSQQHHLPTLAPGTANPNNFNNARPGSKVTDAPGSSGNTWEPSENRAKCEPIYDMYHASATSMPVKPIMPAPEAGATREGAFSLGAREKVGGNGSYGGRAGGLASRRVGSGTNSVGPGNGSGTVSGTSRSVLQGFRDIVALDKVLSLEDRIHVLQRVLQQPTHDFFSFITYLNEHFVLTEHTDRIRSKDYVRLCTLKDDYHSKYPADKERMKIYKIKSFFSSVLQMQVTGEWDRHNHGGVRGPYVYGLRLKPGVLFGSGNGNAPTSFTGRSGDTSMGEAKVVKSTPK